MNMALTFTKKQTGVLRGMGLGIFFSLLLALYGILFNPFSFPELLPLEDKLIILGYCLLIPSFFLMFSIARMARYRFFSPVDIDSSVTNSPSQALLCLQAILQNTLEQAALATIIYLIWVLLTPSSWLSVLPLSASCFFIGRILFIKGFRMGASSRAVGFALTFYPLVIMFIFILFSSLVSVA